MVATETQRAVCAPHRTPRAIKMYVVKRTRRHTAPATHAPVGHGHERPRRNHALHEIRIDYARLNPRESAFDHIIVDRTGRYSTGHLLNPAMRLIQFAPGHIWLVDIKPRKHDIRIGHPDRVRGDGIPSFFRYQTTPLTVGQPYVVATRADHVMTPAIRKAATGGYPLYEAHYKVRHPPGVYRKYPDGQAIGYGNRLRPLK